MGGSRQVLVKEVLFQLRGHGYPQDDATPNFFPDSKLAILGLSNEISFVSKLFFTKVVKIEKMKTPLYDQMKATGKDCIAMVHVNCLWVLN